MVIDLFVIYYQKQAAFYRKSIIFNLEAKNSIKCFGKKRDSIIFMELSCMM